MDKGKNFSPKTWIRYWYGLVAFSFVLIVAGIASSSSDMIVLGVAALVLAPAMIGFWRRRMGEQPDSPNSH